jgi:MYXO-CTERM domain-containing protein
VGLLAAGSASAQGFGGPGGSGYYWQPGVYDYVDLGSEATATDLSLGSDAEINVALPWSFPFYGNSYPTVRVGRTGGVMFILTGDVYNGNDDLPDTGYGSADIAAFWDGLNSSGDVYTWHDASNDRFIISWEGAGFDSNSSQGNVSFQMHLSPNGNVDFHYLDVTTSGSGSLGGRATVGIQDRVGGTAVTGGNFLEYSYNTGSLTDGMSIHFGQDISAVDNDNDGIVSTLDCDDNDVSVGAGTVDLDGDWIYACTDCDDNDATINPAAAEVCADGIDQNCDGYDQPTDVDGDGGIGVRCGGDDCDDSDATVDGADLDGDNFSTCAGDCDDADVLAFPGAPELCDSIDQNCDGVTDDESDNDGDGFTPCNAISGQLPGGDCNDLNANQSPGLPEICNGLDDNCDGVTDDVDVDLDTFIDSDCGGLDCDDNDATINPAAVEVCDGADVDSDCDGISDSFDVDIGTVSSTEVLTDSTVTAIPDNDPAGLTMTLVSVEVDPIIDINVELDITHTWDSDLEITLTSPAGTSVILSDNNGGSGDNYTDTVFDDEAVTPIGNGSAPFTGSFIPDNPLSTFDGELATGTWALLIVDSAGADTGTLDSWTLTIETGTVGDVDGDGSVDTCGDCDATDPLIGEGVPEICDDSIDQDCSGADELSDDDGDLGIDVNCGGDDCDDDDALVDVTTDVDLDLVTVCGGDCDDGDATIFPGADEPGTCDGIDNDCDGFDLVGTDGLADFDGDGEDICSGDCNDLMPAINTSGIEICNGVDNDCDTTIGIDVDLDGATSCGDVDCDDNDALTFPGAVETCDGADLDEDCDGISDSFDLDVGAIINPAEVPASVGVPGPITGATDGVATFDFVGTDPVLEIEVTVDLSHSWDSDLALTLTSPAGTSVLLSDNNGGSGDNYTNTVFTDSATTPITSGSAPFTGSFLPEQLLSTFNGELVTGTWTVTVDDTYCCNPAGTFNSASLSIVTGVYDDADEDGNVDSCGDCDITDPTIFEGAPEICGDTIDQDCDGADDIEDEDLDTYINADCGGDDCDDSLATGALVNPAATEVCNDAIDNDCDVATIDIFDGDFDGDFCDTDCDDADPLAYNGFFEICNDGIDNDCDVVTLDAGDNDGDGSTCDLDCDDTNPNIFPGAVEAFCDGLDNDCDPATIDIGDLDGDTFTCDLDCDDDEASINPAAIEVVCDGIDNDCDPLTISDADVDNDGAGCDTDCDDNNAALFPGNEEICDDALDNDCDPLTADIHDGDLDGSLCDVDCADNDPLVFPGAPEWCNDALDQDCDGVADETVDDSYPLDNDGDVRIGLCGGTTFDMCGSTWDTFYVQSNGRVTFGYSDTDHTESVGEFIVPQIAAMWTDLDPSLNQASDIHITEDDVTGDILITFTDVAEVANAATANSFTLTLWSDDTGTIDFGTNTVMDGMVGFACGDGTNGDLTQVDFSDDVFEPNQWAFGTGTEDALFEVFTEATNPNDTSDSLIDLCLTAGNDDDLDGWTDTCGDCDDADITSFPGAPELCDTIDNDCDGIADNVDLDGDTFIDVDCGGDDCDDTDEITYPGAPEQCDGLDNDCDGAPEDGSEDDDGDEVSICAGDCDDGDDTVYGGDDAAEEICDLLDNDCNGTVDDQFDTDQDGDTYQDADCGGDDCDDAEADVFPGNAEVCDQLDNDCNGVSDDVDADLDTFFSAACGGLDCDDANAEVNPDAEEVPYDEIDNDCSDGDLLDVDGDGYQASTVPGGTDCDDNDAAVNTGALENSDAEGTCSDGKDNNCDSAIDIEDDLCSSCEDCNASYTGSGPMGTAQAAFALLMVLGLGLRRRRE